MLLSGGGYAACALKSEVRYAYLVEWWMTCPHPLPSSASSISTREATDRGMSRDAWDSWLHLSVDVGPLLGPESVDKFEVDLAQA